MNPYTQSLLAQIKDRRLVEFVTHWDALEGLVVRVYKSGQATGQDEAEHARVRPWLQQRYTRWQSALAAHWPQTRAGGEPVQRDPFADLIAPQHAADFVDNWTAMQILPAAREALNGLLVEIIEAESSANQH